LTALATSPNVQALGKDSVGNLEKKQEI